MPPWAWGVVTIIVAVAILAMLVALDPSSLGLSGCPIAGPCP